MNTRAYAGEENVEELDFSRMNLLQKAKLFDERPHLVTPILFIRYPSATNNLLHMLPGGYRRGPELIEAFQDFRLNEVENFHGLHSDKFRSLPSYLEFFDHIDEALKGEGICLDETRKIVTGFNEARKKGESHPVPAELLSRTFHALKRAGFNYYDFAH